MSDPSAQQPQLTESALRAAASTYLQISTTLSPSPILSPNYTHTFAPASCFPPGASTFNLSQFTSQILQSRDVLQSFPLTAKQTWVNPTLNQVTIWAAGEVVWREGVTDGDDEAWKYRGEYIFILTMDGQGRVEKVLEFVDSMGKERVMGLMGRARGNLNVAG